MYVSIKSMVLGVPFIIFFGGEVVGCGGEILCVVGCKGSMCSVWCMV